MPLKKTKTKAPKVKSTKTKKGSPKARKAAPKPKAKKAAPNAKAKKATPKAKQAAPKPKARKAAAPKAKLKAKQAAPKAKPAPKKAAPLAKKARKRAPNLPVNVASAMDYAAISVEERDERGLMPVAKARAFLKGRSVIERGKGHNIGGTHVWDSDLAWAALLSLEGGAELVKTASKRWKMPPRGLSNPGVAERYGRDALEWAKRILSAGHLGPCAECLVATVSAVPDGGQVAYGVVRDIDAQKPSPKYLWAWLAANPGGWRFVGGKQAADREALTRLAKTDAKGAFAGVAAELGEAVAAAAFEAAGVKLPKGVKLSAARKGVALTLGAIEPKFADFEYPMWANSNYFTGAMRVTGFVCDAGQALVWEQLMTGGGDDGISREVTVHASFPVDRSWRVHVQQILRENDVWQREGKNSTSVLTGVKRIRAEKQSSYVVPAGGARTTAQVAKIGKVPLSIDTTGLSDADAALLEGSTGPVEKLMIRLGQEPFRAKVFPKSSVLATQAGLPKGAEALFSFDVFGLPDPGQPASSSPDIVAIVDALASGKKLASLPSEGAHPLAALVSRCDALGGWGDPRMCGKQAPPPSSGDMKDARKWWAGLSEKWRCALQEAASLDSEEALSEPSALELQRILSVERVVQNYQGFSSLEAVRPLTKLKVLLVRGSGKVDTIDALRELTSLEQLDIGECRVIDLSPLAGLQQLRELAIDSVGVTDLAVLASLVNLEKLSITGIPATTLRGLEGLTKLRELNANSSHVSDISALASAKSLERVMLNWLTIADLSPLRGASALRILEMNQAQVGRVDLRGLDQLEVLSAIGAKLEEFSFVGHLPSLKKLHLAGTALPDLSSLAGLEQLEVLDISKTSVTSLAPLKGCTALQQLSIRDTGFTSLDGLPQLTELTKLDASGSCLESIESLAGCSALGNLDISKTFVTDVSPLAGLDQLKDLNLSDTWVASLAGLQGLSLDSLNVLGSAVTELQLIEFQRENSDTSVEPSVDVDDEMPAGAWVRPVELNARDWYMSLDGYYTMLFREAVGVDDDARATDEQCQQMLELEELDLERGEWLSDLSPLEPLKRLRVLRAGGAHVKRLDVLAELQNLEELDLSGCRVRDFSPLGRLPRLARLNLKDSTIADLRPLANARALTHLNVDSTRVTSLAGLESLDALEGLVASRCPLEDLSALKGAGKLCGLDLRQTQVRDLAPLSGLPQLEHLVLTNTPVADLSPLADLPALHTLEVQGAQVVDFSTLGRLLQLRKLKVSGTFADASPLADAKALEELDASNSKLTSLRGLEGHPSLKKLNIDATRVSDLTPLATAVALEYLAANNTFVSDLTPLASLSRLSVAFLNDTEVRSLAPLHALTKLEMVSVEGALVSSDEADAFSEALPEVDFQP